MIPVINMQRLVQLESNYNDSPDVIMKLNELFSFFKRDVEFDVDKVKQSFSDSSITTHFMLITRTRPRMGGMTDSGMTMEEHSEDIFSAFREMAQATGGLVTSSADAAASFEKAVDASENYYLLYYSPLNYRPDGKFKNIRVRVKGQRYRITHRAGYFAD